MESQRLLKRHKNRNNEENNYKQNIIKAKLTIYFFNLLNYLKKYYRIIIICSILFFITFKIYKSNTKNTINDLINEKEQLINKTIDKNNINNKSFIYNNENKSIANNRVYKNNTENNLLEAKLQLNEEEEIEITFEEEEIKKEENFINMTNILETINNYIYFCKNDILINEIKKPSLNPKITAIIASYNSAKTIKASIRSIQNQKMSDLEIIIVNDASTDNSLNIIESLQKK